MADSIGTCTGGKPVRYVPIAIIRVKMEKIKIGKIVNAVALRGEVKVYSYAGSKERYEELAEILVEEKKGLKAYEIEGVRYQKNIVILKLKGVNDRNAAEALKERDIYMNEEDLPELPEDTFYVRDLMGCEVRIGKTGAVIGTIREVLQGAAQDIYVITLKNGKEAMIPAVAEFIKDVDMEARTVTVELIPGFIDDEAVRTE